MSPMVTHSPKIALVSRQNCSVRLCGAATDDKLWKSFPFIQVHPTIPANTSQHLSTAEPPVRMFLRCLRRKPRPTLIAVSKYDMIRKGRTWTNVTKLCLRFRKMSCGNVWPCDPIKLNAAKPQLVTAAQHRRCSDLALSRTSLAWSRTKNSLHNFKAQLLWHTIVLYCSYEAPSQHRCFLHIHKLKLLETLHLSTTADTCQSICLLEDEIGS